MSVRVIEPGSPGFSLIELLIAMALGMVLTLGMITYFSSNQRNAELNSAMIDMQESARYAMEALSKNIRQSGYQGCLDINRGKISVQSKQPPTTDLRATATVGSVVVSDSVWTPAPPPLFTLPLSLSPIVGTHALSVQYAGTRSARLLAQMTDDAGYVSRSGPLRIDADLGLQVGDHAMIASCDTVDLFRVSDVSIFNPVTGPVESVIEHDGSLNVSGNLTRAYGDAKTGAQTRVMRFHSNVYYVGDTGQRNEHGDRITALYQRTLPFDDDTNPPTEVVQGVENMRLALGIREAGGNLRYVSPDDGGFDPARVETVKIGLLMASWDRIADEDDLKTYLLVDHPIPPAIDADDGLAHATDRRLRLAFHATVKVRNRRSVL